MTSENSGLQAAEYVDHANQHLAQGHEPVS